LTHAICLACAGSPLAIGRAPELNKFVKNDKVGQECYIEVDILTNTTIHTIKREINAENKSSTWSLDRRKATESMVKDLMKSLSIDMNNLCSFMPQDRVGRFTRLTATEILQETLKCIHSNSGDANKTLYDVQQELSTHEEKKLKSQEDKVKKQSEILRLESQINQLKGDVDRMHARQELLKQLEVVRLAEKLFQVKDIQSQRVVQQAQLDDLSTQLARANDMITPLEAKERDLKRQQQQIDRAVDTAEKAYKAAINKLKQCKEFSENIDENIENVSIEIDNIQRNRAEKESKLSIAKNELRKHEQELASAEEAIPKIEGKLSEVAAELKSLDQDERALEEDRAELHNQLLQQGSVVKELTKELNDLKDHAQIFRRQFEKNVPNARKVLDFMDWIDKNQTHFQAEVFGPIGKYLRISDPACAAMVENAIPFKALTATFIALTKEDGNALKKYLAGKNLGINIVTLVNLEFPPTQYPVDKDRYRHIGLQGYLIDQIKCPDPVLAYLHMNLSLQNILWCRVDLSKQSIKMEDVNEISLNRLYVDNIQSTSRRQSQLDISLYSGTRSRYGAKKVSISTDRVRPKDILTSSVEDDSETVKASLDQRLEHAKRQQAEQQKKINQLTDQLEKIRAAVHKCRDQRTKLQHAMKIPQNTKPKVDSSRRRVRDIECVLSSDVHEEKRVKLMEYQRHVDDFQGVLMKISDLGKASLDNQIDLLVADDARSQLRDQIHQARQAIDDARAGLRELNRSIDQCKDRLKDYDQQMRSIETKLRDQEYALGSESFNQLMNQVLDLEASLNITTVAGAQDRIEYIELQLSRSHDNPAVIQRYNDLKRTHEAALQEFQALEQNYLDLEENLRHRSESWFESVENLRRKLNARFGEYMEELRFKGEIELIKQGKISEYALQMKVAFKEDGILANLSGLRHSGGERNVSTIMYLMALQDETISPFRIVDEINQGMDERNERLVCDRIVRNCCGSSRSPQYFLITPKLLEALQALDNNDITVLVIFNGPGAAVKWDIPAYIQTLAHQYRNLLPDNILEDSDDEVVVVNNERNAAAAFVSPVVVKKRTMNAMTTSSERSVEGNVEL
jgi:structural maintenance of chromosomes protein 5